MEWSQIIDPDKEYEFSNKAWEVIKDSWLPEEIQDLINKKGVVGMVKEINDFYSSELRRPKPLRRSNLAGQKMVLAMLENRD